MLEIQVACMCMYLGVTVLVKLVVSEVRVQLDLVDCGLDFGILQQVFNLLHTEVGDTNALDQTLLNQLLHLLPCLLYSMQLGTEPKLSRISRMLQRSTDTTAVC